MISVPLNPARAERAFPPALLLLCGLLVLTWPARAHDPGLSALTLRLGASEITACLVISETETAAVPARGPVRLVCDGRGLAAPFRTMSISTNGQDVVWNFSWARPDGSELEIHAAALATLPRGHRQFVKVLDARDQTLGTALLSAEQPSLKVIMPGAPVTALHSSSAWWKWILVSGPFVLASVWVSRLLRPPRRTLAA